MAVGGANPRIAGGQPVVGPQRGRRAADAREAGEEQIRHAPVDRIGRRGRRIVMPASRADVLAPGEGVRRVGRSRVRQVDVDVLIDRPRAMFSEIGTPTLVVAVTPAKLGKDVRRFVLSSGGIAAGAFSMIFVPRPRAVRAAGERDRPGRRDRRRSRRRTRRPRGRRAPAEQSARDSASDAALRLSDVVRAVVET